MESRDEKKASETQKTKDKESSDYFFVGFICGTIFMAVSFGTHVLISIFSRMP